MHEYVCICQIFINCVYCTNVFRLFIYLFTHIYCLLVSFLAMVLKFTTFWSFSFTFLVHSVLSYYVKHYVSIILSFIYVLPILFCAFIAFWKKKNNKKKINQYLYNVNTFLNLGPYNHFDEDFRLDFRLDFIGFFPKCNKSTKQYRQNLNKTQYNWDVMFGITR